MVFCVEVLGFLVAKSPPVSMPGKTPDPKQEYQLEGSYNVGTGTVMAGFCF